MEPNQQFSKLASDEQIEKTVTALSEHNITSDVVETKDEARQKLLDLLPDGAEVFSMTSMTLEALDVLSEVNESGRYNSVRQRLNVMDKNQIREKRKLGSAPDWAIGSVHAVTEDGTVFIASNTGSQLPAYAYGGGNVIWVVSTKKIVKDIDQGMKRLYEYSLPLEDVRAQEAYGMHSQISKILMITNEPSPNRLHIIFVKEDLGF